MTHEVRHTFEALPEMFENLWLAECEDMWEARNRAVSGRPLAHTSAIHKIPDGQQDLHIDTDNNENVYLTSWHQVHATQVSALQTGLCVFLLHCCGHEHGTALSSSKWPALSFSSMA